MRPDWRRRMMAIGLGTYLAGFGMLAGLAVQHIRFDQERAEALARHDQLLRQWHQYQMAREKEADARR